MIEKHSPTWDLELRALPCSSISSSRTIPEADSKKVDTLIKQLGDDDFTARERAFDGLLDIGPGALLGIKEASKNKDAEVSRRADELRHLIEAKAEPAIQSATARLIAELKPPGAAQVLLNYLPFAADQQVADELCRTLSAVAQPGGKLEPRLLEALEDKVPIKRAAAGEAIVRARQPDQLPKARKLLQDPEPTVRLRVALAMVPLKEHDILPVLVDLLGSLSPEQLWPVEEILVRLAGDKTPAVSLGTTEATRKQCRDAWKAWLDKEGQNINLARLEEAQVMLGYTLIVQTNRNAGIANGVRQAGAGEVLELDAAKNPRWKFPVSTYAVNAQIVKVDGADRVLVAEYQGGKISERDFKGEVRWEKAVGGNPTGVQRLANGNTFVAMPNNLIEIDRTGKEVFSMPRQNNDIYRARKLRNGDVVFITNTGAYSRIDGKTQNVLKTFSTVANIPLPFGGIDVLPDGGVLVADAQQNRVVEYNADGKEMKSLHAQFPNSVLRLPNGHTLVTSYNARRISELDATGRETWFHMVEGQPFIARRR